jgi:PKD repeat protein
MVLTKCAPYHGVLQSGNLHCWGDHIGVDWIAYGNANRFLQTGNVTQIKFYAVEVAKLAELKIKIWTEKATDGIFNLKSTSANFAPQLVNGLNVIDLSSTPISVAEGEYYGIYIKANIEAAVTPIGIYATNSEYEGNCRAAYNATSTNFNWGNVTGSNGTINLEFYMETPQIIFTGDSIISGQALSFACTNQGFYAPASDFSNVIPSKLQGLTGLTYQNIATSGINYPRIYNEFYAWALQHQPQYILIEGGINNLKADHTAEFIFSYIQQQILDCQAASVTPIVCLVFPTSGQLTASQVIQYEALNQLIINYQGVNNGFLLVDCRDDLGTYSGGTWVLNGSYSSDGLHLNEAGNTLVAQRIANVLPRPMASFVFSNTRNSNVVQFTDTSTNSPTSYSWDFGDGTTSNLPNPSHTYDSPSIYTVKLTVANSSGSGYCVNSVKSCSVTASINSKPIGYQAKEVNPSKRLVKNETPGKNGCSIDDLGEGGLDITVDVLAIGDTPAATIQERDEIVEAFMKEGRSVYKPGGVDVGWHYTGVCGDRSSSLKLNKDYPEKAYPMSFLFCTDTPYLESDVQHAKSFNVPYSYIIKNIDNYIPGNSVKNYCFDLWSNGTTGACPDYWILGSGSSGGYRSTDAYLGTYSYAVDGDGTTLAKGQIIQYFPFVAGKKYVIGARIKVTGRTLGYAALSVRGGDGSLIDELEINRNTNGWEWFSFVYDCIETTPRGYISLVAYGTANVGSTFKFNNITVTEFGKIENPDLFGSISTFGTVPTIPDIELQSGYIHNPNSTTGTSYEKRKDDFQGSTKNTSYQLQYTITVPAKSGVKNRIDAVGLKLHSSSTTVGREAWGKITIQAAHINSNVETTAGEWSTLSTSYVSKSASVNITDSTANEAVTVRFYVKSANSSYSAYIKYFYVDYTEITSVVTVPGYMSILNIADETTICKLCNKLYPGSTYRINADGTGYFEYIDDFTDVNYIPMVVVDSNGTAIQNNVMQMNAAGYLVYKFDVKYPIVGSPTLIMYITGAVQASIAEDVNGGPGTFQSIDFNPPSSETEGRYFTYILKNTYNLTLAGNTIFYFKVTTLPGQTCSISSMYLKCDLETIDAERIKLNPGANLLKFQGVGDMNCNFSLYFHDRKWGI